jgi:uncharacterized membrane protein YsdA (DUF1294 family)
VPDGALAAIIYFVAVNCACFLAFAWDKHLARTHQWRISERLLLTLAAVGGTIGAFAAKRRLRHKTRKEPFRTRLRVIAAIQLIVLTALLVPEVRDAIRRFLEDTIGIGG